MTEWLTHDDFAGLVGDGFDLVLPDGEVLALTLAQAALSPQVGGAGPGGTPRQQFSLLFHGPVAPVLPQATRTLRHARLGTFETFLVPVGPRGDVMQYEAVYA
ncbi:DUF6916 family protein [Nocardioides sp. J54]|uniref:DUF6916 family protein n=1 Tax=Nocardioides sp. J54 TaxID=935866 RepID=UPI000490A820|nr:hypothetical protein [Nocardioides sp. J54]